MAQANIHNPLGFKDKRVTAGASDHPIPGGRFQHYSTVERMRARLTAINSTYFNSKKLDQMTANDMIFAIRLRDDAAGFALTSNGNYTLDLPEGDKDYPTVNQHPAEPPVNW